MEPDLRSTLKEENMLLRIQLSRKLKSYASTDTTDDGAYMTFVQLSRKKIHYYGFSSTGRYVSM